MKPHFCFICEAFETAVLNFLHLFLNIQIANNTDDDDDDHHHHHHHHHHNNNNNYNNVDGDNNSNSNKYNESLYQ